MPKKDGIYKANSLIRPVSNFGSSKKEAVFRRLAMQFLLFGCVHFMASIEAFSRHDTACLPCFMREVSAGRV